MGTMTATVTDAFVLEVSGAGEAITLEPVGMIDLNGARTMLAAMESLRSDRHAALLQIRFDRVTGATAEAREALATGGIPIDDLLSTGVG
jgi:hypothetical protein